VGNNGSGCFFVGLFAGLVAAAPEGGLVFGMAIGGSTPVIVVAIAAAAILTIVGAILTANAFRDMFQDIMSKRPAISATGVRDLVSVLKSCFATSVLGHMIELAYMIGELSWGQE